MPIIQWYILAQAVHKKRHVGTNRTITLVFDRGSYDFHNVTDRGKMVDAIIAQWRVVKYV